MSITILIIINHLLKNIHLQNMLHNNIGGIIYLIDKEDKLIGR